jgi:hypothetical protein
MGTTGEAVSLQKMAGKLKKTSLKLVKKANSWNMVSTTKVGNYYCKHVHQYVAQDFWRVKPSPMRNLHSWPTGSFARLLAAASADSTLVVACREGAKPMLLSKNEEIII